MPRYLLSTHVVDSEAREPMIDEQMQHSWREIQALEAEMKSSGAWVFSGRLHDADTATVVRVSGDAVLTRYLTTHKSGISFAGASLVCGNLPAGFFASSFLG